MHKLILASLALALTFPCAIAQEALQSYEVELVIFRVNRPSASPEDWSVMQKAPVIPSSASEEEEERAAAAAAPTAPPASIDTNFPPLAPAAFRLTGVEDSLRRSKAYQPLAHIGWTQPGFPLGSSPKFSLQSYLPSFLPEGVNLSGEVSLARGPRLLHLTLDLTYQAPDGQRYVLRETRRMRSTDRHYIDHPYFGVVALVTPRK